MTGRRQGDEFNAACAALRADILKEIEGNAETQGDDMAEVSISAVVSISVDLMLAISLSHSAARGNLHRLIDNYFEQAAEIDQHPEAGHA